MILNVNIKREAICSDDNIIIKKFFKGLEGGRALYIPDNEKIILKEGDKTTITEIYYTDVLRAGNPIIRTQRLTGTYYEPIAMKKVTIKEEGKEDIVTLSYNTDAEGNPAFGQYVGILYGSILKTKATAQIMTHGVVNPNVDNIIDENAMIKIHEACPGIDFQIDLLLGSDDQKEFSLDDAELDSTAELL